MNTSDPALSLEQTIARQVLYAQEQKCGAGRTVFEMEGLKHALGGVVLVDKKKKKSNDEDGSLEDKRLNRHHKLAAALQDLGDAKTALDGSSHHSSRLHEPTTHKMRESFSQLCSDSASSLMDEGSFRDQIAAGGDRSAAEDSVALLEKLAKNYKPDAHYSFDLHNLSAGDNLIMIPSSDEDGDESAELDIDLDYRSDGGDIKDDTQKRHTRQKNQERKSTSVRKKKSETITLTERKPRSSRTKRGERAPDNHSTTASSPLRRAVTTDGTGRRNRRETGESPNLRRAPTNNSKTASSPLRRAVTTDDTGRRNHRETGESPTGRRVLDNHTKTASSPVRRAVTTDEAGRRNHRKTGESPNVRRASEAVAFRRSGTTTASGGRGRRRDRARDVAAAQLMNIGTVCEEKEAQEAQERAQAEAAEEALRRAQIESLKKAALARGPSVSTVIANKIRNDPGLLEKFLLETQDDEEIRANLTQGPPSVISGHDDGHGGDRRRSLGERTAGKRRVRAADRGSIAKSTIEPGTYRSVLGSADSNH
ncbi:expressed unknown protein [Seminavis robusta]|uniref:Uncharacterized protein n=1 Tax=Seminavis robusta TaxID=568900 RepID=A0A9N8DXB3_9STRA|nr:expressed unknown protein [Seminavis robusta]|eukprot:Sro447_g144800.1 n/a (537) ;mRNA; f:5934-7544